MVTYNINLDLVKDTYTNFKCKQNDDIVLKFNIYNNSLIENLTGSTVILNALRNNNTFVKQTNNIIIDKNIITINCLRDITRVGGKLKLELVIIKDNKQTTTFNIDATVVNSVITDNAEASKNVVSVIEELDHKIAQGKEIVAEVDRKKTEAIDTVNKLKTDTIATVTQLKDATITQLNTTKKDVETLKQQTIEESTKIKDSAIGELSKIKTESITELTKIKESSITELNSIKDTASIDLNKIKKDTIDTVNTAVNNAIAEINKYNIKEVNDKIDNHITDKNLHVTKELKDSIAKNAIDLDILNKDLNESTLSSFTTDKSIIKLENSKDGLITNLDIRGKTLVNLFRKDITSDIADTTGNNKYFAFYMFNNLLKSNTKYTVKIFDTNNKVLRYLLILRNGDNASTDIQLTPGYIDKNKFIFSTPNDIDSSWRLLPHFIFSNNNPMTQDEINNLKVIILEGDWTNKEMSLYFEGIKSVAENEGNKVEILTTKNDDTTGEKLSIQLSEPLRSISDSIYDEIKDGVLYRRCGQINLNGSENWVLHPWTPLQTKTIAFYLDDKGLNLNQKAGGYSISSKIKAVVWDEMCKNDTDGMAIASDTSIIIKVDRAKIGLSSSDTDTIKIQKLKTWLQSNNVTFVFELKTTTTEPLNKSLILSTFKNCSLQLNNSITPMLSGKYGTNLGGSLESVASSVRNINDIYSVPSNPNLLINGDFQVWQRGETFERKNNIYTADRMYYDNYGKGGSWNGKVQKIDNGLRLTQLDNASMNHRLIYRFEHQPILNDKIVTISIKYKTNKAFTITIFNTLLNLNCDGNVNTLTFTTKYTEVKDTICFALWNNTDENMFFELYNIKLELGDKATPFVPRLYVEELMLCQRYYERWESNGGRLNIGVGTCGFAKQINIGIAFKVTKRIPPSFIYSGQFRRLPAGGQVKIGIGDCNTQTAQIVAYDDTVTILGQAYLIQNNDSNPTQTYIAFDAEIY